MPASASIGPACGRGATWVTAAALALSTAGLMLASPPVQAESLRCNGQSTGPGDSRIAVLHKCGPPLLQDSYCAPVFVPGRVQPQRVLPGWSVPCVPVDEWLYDRGPGNLTATVRFQGGVVQDIVYGQQPR